MLLQLRFEYIERWHFYAGSARWRFFRGLAALLLLGMVSKISHTGKSSHE